jgi:hypothetical protein
MGASAISNSTLLAQSLGEDEQKISRWIEQHLGGVVTEVVRQRRWRPVWRATVEKNGVTGGLLFKSTRTWNDHPYPLKHELHMLEVLAAQGIPVPPLHGMCPDPKAIVMEWVRGGRDPGLVQQAIENRSTMSADRWAASLKYMEILAAMHKIPPAAFAAAGATMPRGATDIALNSFERFYDMCRQAEIVDPFMEFCATWLRRNVPAHRSRISFVTGDCGQFLSDGNQVTAVLDMEVGHLGDPLHDLACFRGRHPIENMGDLPTLFRHYERALGEPLDLRTIAYHTVVFLCIGYYAPLFALNETAAGGDWVECAVQVALIGRRCAEALAELLGIELEEIQLPEATVTPLEDMALNKLIAEIGRVPLSETFADWQRNVVAAIPRYLRNQIHFRTWAEQGDLADAEALLGHRPRNLLEADRELVSYVRGAGPQQDAALVRLFYRRTLRQCLIIAGPGATPDHIALVKLEPLFARMT